MLFFMNPKHVPNSGSCPWVEILDRTEIEGTQGYVAKSSFKFNDGDGTDGWIVRDYYFNLYNESAVVATTTFVNTQEAPEDRKVVASFPTWAALEAAPIPGVPGDGVIVTDDEHADFGTGQDFRGNEILYRITATAPYYEFVKVLGRKWNVLYTASGHTQVLWDKLPDSGPGWYRLTFKNNATAWYKWSFTTPQPVPKPNSLVEITYDPAWVIGDLITVGYTPIGGDFIAQYLGLYESINTATGKAMLRIILSDYEYGGVKQYATFADFPDPTVESVDISEHFIYVARDTQYGYTWRESDHAYHIVTDISGKANLYNNGTKIYDIKDLLELYTALANAFDADHITLTQHVGDTTVHIQPGERTKWDKAAADIDTHVANPDLHFDLAPITPVTDTVTKSMTRQHLQDAAKTIRADHHMTPTDWTNLDGKADKKYVDDEIEDLEDDLTALTEKVAALSGLGRYLETYDTYEDLQSITMAYLLAKFPGIAPNDFVNLRVDSSHNNSSTRWIYRGPQTSEPTMPQWEFDIILDNDISGLMDQMVNGIPGYIPTVGANGKQLTGTQIDPATLSLKSELEAHKVAKTANNAYIHVNDDDRNAWNGVIDDLAEHVDNTAIHVTATDKTAWNKVITDLSAHESDNVRHITATERTTWNGKAEQSALDAEATARANADIGLQNQLNLLRDTGLYLGQVEVYTDLPKNTTGTFKAKVGDFMLVNIDSTSNNNIALWRVTAISGTTITWSKDIMWRNTAVELTLYARQVQCNTDYSNTETIPDMSSKPLEYFDIQFVEDAAIMRCIGSRHSGSLQIVHWFMTTKAQRVHYTNVAHYYGTGYPSQDAVIAGVNHDALKWSRNFGNGSNLNEWYRMNDAWGILMNAQERNESSLIFPATGNVYNFLMIDTSPDRSSSTSVVSPFIEIRKSNAVLKTTADPNDRIIQV
jgi:hypothetical protein